MSCLIIHIIDISDSLNSIIIASYSLPSCSNLDTVALYFQDQTLYDMSRTLGASTTTYEVFYQNLLITTLTTTTLMEYVFQKIASWLPENLIISTKGEDVEVTSSPC
jgi:hypothetical protein